METEKKIILFDGVCNLCNGAVQYIIKKDKQDMYRFASLQSEIGQQLCKERGIDTTEIDSMILIDPGKAYYTKSDAALQIGKTFGGFWSLLWLPQQLPTAFRNAIYDWVARNRYNWYGKKDACMIPTPELKAKFL